MLHIGRLQVLFLMRIFFCLFVCFVIPFYLQSVQIHSQNCVKIDTMACCSLWEGDLQTKQIRQLHLESGRQIVWYVSSKSPVVRLRHEVHY
jgi:hypothetical protein